MVSGITHAKKDNDACSHSVSEAYLQILFFLFELEVVLEVRKLERDFLIGKYPML